MPNFTLRSTILLLAAVSSAHAVTDWNAARQVLSESCYDCHNTKKTKGGVDLKRLDANPNLEKEYAMWEKVREVIDSGSMPPEDETQLTKEEKHDILEWMDKELEIVATRNAGDPGPVTLRRLTNAEYDYTIRDLTGVDFKFASEFLPDGGGGEGFSNIGDVLFTNPTQLEKYLTAARKIADHATILPGTGVEFQEQRVGMRGYDQVKGQAQQGLYVWYQKMSGPYLPKDGEDFREAEYMLACWKWKHKDLTGAQSLDQLAKDTNLSPAFLANWWRMLHNEKIKSRFLDLTRTAWHNLPGPDAAKPKEVPAAVLAGAKAIQVERRSWNNPLKAGSGVQRRQQDSDGLRSYPAKVAVDKGVREAHLVVGDLGDGAGGDLVQLSNLNVRRQGKTINYQRLLKVESEAGKKLLSEIEGGKPAPKGVTVEGLKKYLQSVDKTLALYGKDPLGKGDVAPEVLCVQAPAVISLPLPEGVNEVNVAGKLDMRSPEVDKATVQWTLVTGTPPNPSAIIPGVLTVWKRQTEAARSTMSDFGRMKTAFPDMFERRLEEVARNFYNNGTGPGVYYFTDEQLLALLPEVEKKRLKGMRTDWDYVWTDKLPKEKQAEYDKLLRQHLKTFASIAWRRPADDAEKQQIEALYNDGVTKGLDRESAAREVVARVLVSPHFLFKTELSPVAAPEPESPATDHPVSAWELASRMSYFLWSSKPDEQLRKVASDGSLLKPEVREAQVRRMLRSPKAQAMAKEFMGQWLEFSGFEKHSAVDGKKFPEFTPELREDLYEETLTFFAHLIREDRPVREIINADYTFLNERLAKFYGVPGVTGEQFKQVSVTAQNRGGLLGMGSVLIKTSRSHRTSPVLRGNWLLQSVLGTPVPPPPADVPELKEHGPTPATVREMLEQHRASKACSSCHDRIDPLGFALENFDALGRFRDKDEAGLPLDTSAQVKSTKFTGFAGLREYLASHESQFSSQFARKLLGYALGRSVQPSDKQLLKAITAKTMASDSHFSAAVLEIVNSRQFLNRRY
ncbi:cytochrome c [Roseimicrobium gellanilyticum]|uniref:Cytochrome c n=1 Tax=Roseimicrobium gellanilyticum TaxID=748857 RepID=A0A366H2F5_9BACT|nr:DUF1592 domain-containing protein [Roseimicrobium gellanilyticum]RBP36082.1 cytochrome c [Roseimicrobium gellanilyticum]